MLLYILLSQIDFDDVTTTVVHMDLRYIAIGFVLYICSYFLRAFRFYILLGRDININSLFNIVCIHNFLNSLLPARTGELSYIYMLKKLHNKDIAVGASTLVISRIYDFIAISSIFLISAWMVRNLLGRIQELVYIVAIFMILCVIILVAISRTGEAFLQLVSSISGLVGVEENHFMKYFMTKTTDVIRAMERMRTIRMGSWALFISILIWAANYSMVFFVLKGLSFSLPLQLVVVGSTFTLLSTLLPISGIANFGTSEGVWTLVFVPLGLTLDHAIISGLGYHIVLIAFYSLLGLYGLIRIKLTKPCPRPIDS